MDKSYVIGIDFGSDSVRSIIADSENGNEVASSVFYYFRWKKGMYCDKSVNQFRQHPLDYIEGIEKTIKNCVKQAGSKVVANIKGIGVDTTGSTPVAVDKTGTPLALLPEFEKNPNAMFVLWKDHTSVKEAAEINKHAKKFDINYLRYVGGIYSSEWFWAKLLHILRVDKAVRDATYSWVEHCDWIPFLLTGGKDVTQMKRSVCAASHKALYAKEFKGFPPEEFFATLDPLLKGFRKKLFAKAHTSDKPAGTLSDEWRKKLGLPEGVVVAVGGFDAHIGAVGGQIEPYQLSKVMGTSTCDIMVSPTKEIEGKLVKGICGQVHGSVIPGMVGLEAGQSSFGDAYAWFRDLVAWPLKNILADSPFLKDDDPTIIDKTIDSIIPELSKQASLLPLDKDAEMAVDWINGRRTPDADQELKGAFTGLSLGSDAPRLFRAVVEATCFGAKAIIERFVEEGIPVKGVIGLGGVAKKSPFIMQMMADVIDMPIKIHNSEQTCAHGAAMFAATASGIYKNVETAMGKMGQGFGITYFPDKARVPVYKMRYAGYKKLGHFIEKGKQK